MTATFWSQGWGQLAAALVALASLAAFKKQIINDPAGYAHHLDFVWRLVIGLGAVPGACALYFRLTLPETPRFTMDVERNIKQASSDVDAFLQTGGYVTDQTPAVAGQIAAPKATWRDFGRHFRKYENFKLLFGTAFTWFALDVAFYGLGLNSSIILSAIGYGSPSSGTPSEKRYYALHNNAVGNIIITVAGLIPGFWASFALIDFWGRRVSVSSVNLLVAAGGELIQTFRPRFCPFSRQPIQIMGFAMLTITLTSMGFGYWRLKEHAVGAFVFLYCISKPLFLFLVLSGSCSGRSLLSHRYTVIPSTTAGPI